MVKNNRRGWEVCTESSNHVRESSSVVNNSGKFVDKHQGE